MAKLTNLSDEQLIDRLKNVLSNERRYLAEFLRVLGEVDFRKIYADRGFESMFTYCGEELGLSEDQAYRRIASARVGRRFPEVLQLIASGKIHMTAVATLSKHLTAENQQALISAACGKSKEAVKHLIATKFPKPDAKPSIRRLPSSSSSSSSSSSPSPSPSPSPGPASPPSSPANGPKEPRPMSQPQPQPQPEPGAIVEPTSADRYLIRFAGSGRTKELLDKAKDLLGHKSPNADVGEIMEQALEVLVEQLEKKKFKVTDRPRKSSRPEPEPGDRYVPNEVKREVHERDGGRCTYVSPSGRRCNATRCLEFHHLESIACEGKSTVDNLCLRCRTHNVQAAEKELGEQEMYLHAKGFRPVPKKTARSALTRPARQSMVDTPPTLASQTDARRTRHADAGGSG